MICSGGGKLGGASWRVLRDQVGFERRADIEEGVRGEEERRRWWRVKGVGCRKGVLSGAARRRRRGGWRRRDGIGERKREREEVVWAR